MNTTSIIEGARALLAGRKTKHAEPLRGAPLTTDQALEVAFALGMEIRESRAMDWILTPRGKETPRYHLSTHPRFDTIFTTEFTAWNTKRTGGKEEGKLRRQLLFRKQVRMEVRGHGAQLITLAVRLNEAEHNSPEPPKCMADGWTFEQSKKRYQSIAPAYQEKDAPLLPGGIIRELAGGPAK